MQLLDPGHRLYTGHTPGRPEVDEDKLATHICKTDARTGGCLERKGSGCSRQGRGNKCIGILEEGLDFRLVTEEIRFVFIGNATRGFL